MLFPITSTHTTRVQVKALTEELENPLNVHRWRRLEGTDPQAYEMIIKIQTLQKKLTQKTEEVTNKHTHITLHLYLHSNQAKDQGEISKYVGIGPHFAYVSIVVRLSKGSSAWSTKVWR